MILKGQEIRLKIEGAEIAKSTNCTLSLTVNTMDSSSKDDDDAMFDNQEASHYTWNCTNESFVTSVEGMKELLTKYKGAETVSVEITDPRQVTSQYGQALITSININAPVNEKATLSVSLQGRYNLNEGV